MPAVVFTSVSTTSWTVPNNVSSITIEAIGGGGGGGNCTCNGQGGIGGNYAKTTLSVTPGSTVYIKAGNSANPQSSAGGTAATSGNDSWANTATSTPPTTSTTGVLARGGGSVSSSIYKCITYSGGIGGSASSCTGGGGGGAAGPLGPGGNACNTNHAGGGGGNGITGGGGASGISGSTVPYSPWGASYGPGSGGGGNGGNGGLYGGGGANQATGAQGIVVISYTGILGRLTNTGTLLVNGSFDEITKTSTSMDSTTIYAPNTGGFDEVSGMILNDNNLLLDLNANINRYYVSKDATTIWNDISNNHYNYTPSAGNPQFTTTGSIGYYTYNGTTQYHTVNKNFADNLSNMTVSAWVRNNLGAAQFKVIVGKGWNGTPGTAGWFLGGNTGNIGGTTGNPNFYFLVQDAGGVHYNLIASPILPNFSASTWSHVVATLSGSATGTIALYYNGLPVASAFDGSSNKNLITSYSTGSFVSVANDNLSEFWTGDISQVQIYNRTLSATEILTNYNFDAAKYGLSPVSTATSLRLTTSTTYIGNIFDEVTGAV
jgi:hypothetical protein